MNTQTGSTGCMGFRTHFRHFYATPLSILMALMAAVLIALLSHNTLPSDIKRWGISELGAVFELGLIFNLIMFLMSWCIMAARQKVGTPWPDHVQRAINILALWIAPLAAVVYGSLLPGGTLGQGVMMALFFLCILFGTHARSFHTAGH